MGTSFEQFANELRAFRASNEIINELRRDLRKPVPDIRKKVRENAVTSLPSRGGFGAWVAKFAMTIRVKTAGKSAGIKLKLSRKSGKEKADLKALDDSGAIRHPLFGNRKIWFSQSVSPGFFSDVWDETGDDWQKVAEDAVDRAFDKIRRG